MTQALTADQLESEPFAMSLPWYILVRGDLTGKTVQLQYSMKGETAEDDWELGYQFEGDDKILVLPGFENGGVIFRFVASHIGLRCYYGVANISFDAR